MKYSKYVIIVGDGKDADYLKNYKEILTQVGNNNKSSLMKMNGVVGVTLDSENEDAIKKIPKDIMGSATKFVIKKCLTSTGEGTIEPFEFLLNIY